MTKEVDKIYKNLRTRIPSGFSDSLLREKAKIAYEIIQLKKQKNALVLAHNYMDTILYYSIPDFVGDSLELSRKAAATDKDIIVFCGVKFMAETAKILNPSKMVIVPSLEAGCSLAESICADDVRRLKQQYPGVPVVTYVNSYADVKAESDICCTSGNVNAVVESLHSDTVIFIPDEYMARNVACATGKHVIVPKFPDEKSEKTEVETVTLEVGMVVWKGRCEVHEKFSKEDIDNARKAYPGVVILAHPECSPEVIEAVDYAGGTTGMAKYVQQTDAPYYLLLTECSMAKNISAANPQKQLIKTFNIRCPHMEKINLENTLISLQKEQFQIEIPSEIQDRARQAIIRMLAIG